MSKNFRYASLADMPPEIRNRVVGVAREAGRGNLPKRQKNSPRATQAKTAGISEGKSKPSKYRNRKKEVDGILFDSEKEARRYGELKLMEAAKEIAWLTRQQEFTLVVNMQIVCKYRADFSYWRVDKQGFTIGNLVVEDVKSEHTRKLPVYRLKKKLMRACLGIEITEV